MAIIRYNPFSLLDRSFFKPFFFEDSDWPEYTMTEGLNVYEENNQVFVEAPVPGIPTDKIEVTYEDGVLRIAGRVEEKEEEKKKDRVVHRRQRVASFDYTTVLPRPINPQTIEANTKNGVVVVSAEIAEAAKPKKIPVKVNAEK